MLLREQNDVVAIVKRADVYLHFRRRFSGTDLCVACSNPVFISLSYRRSFYIIDLLRWYFFIGLATLPRNLFNVHVLR